MKFLNVMSCAYRATSEEQDDTVLWFVQTLRSAGGEVDLLLRGNCVNYAVAAQRAEPVCLGNWIQRHPPALAEDLARFIGSGGGVYVVNDDLAQRGIAPVELVDGVRLVGRGGIPTLYDRYARVFSW